MVQIKRIPEAPRDERLSINYPRPVRFSTEWTRNNRGEPVKRTTWKIVDGKAEKVGKR